MTSKWRKIERIVLLNESESDYQVHSMVMSQHAVRRVGWMTQVKFQEEVVVGGWRAVGGRLKINKGIAFRMLF